MKAMIQAPQTKSMPATHWKSAAEAIICTAE
jgi:hypothetical protein